MIAYLQGKILEKGLTYIILENNGIGYKVFTIPEILQSNIGDEIKLYTYLKVSDDGQALFGLPDFNSLQFFELLITVSGVGPKVALAILSAARVDSGQAGNCQSGRRNFYAHLGHWLEDRGEDYFGIKK